MKEDLVSIPTAKLLKSLGFNEPTLFFAYEDNQYLFFASSLVGCYDRDSPNDLNYSKNSELLDHHGCLLNGEGIQAWSLPSQFLAKKWLREIHNINVSVDWSSTLKGITWWVMVTRIGENLKNYMIFESTHEVLETHEQATELGLLNACKYLFNQSK